MIDFSYVPTFARYVLPADAELIVDGLRVLEIGGVSGVEDGFGHCGSSIREPVLLAAISRGRKAREAQAPPAVFRHTLFHAQLRSAPGCEFWET